MVRPNRRSRTSKKSTIKENCDKNYCYSNNNNNYSKMIIDKTNKLDHPIDDVIGVNLNSRQISKLTPSSRSNSLGSTTSSFDDSSVDSVSQRNYGSSSSSFNWVYYYYLILIVLIALLLTTTLIIFRTSNNNLQNEYSSKMGSLFLWTTNRIGVISQLPSTNGQKLTNYFTLLNKSAKNSVGFLTRGVRILAKKLIDHWIFWKSNFVDIYGFDIFECYYGENSVDLLLERKLCETSCELEIVESIPENLNLQANRFDKNDNVVFVKSTFEAWLELLSLARSELNIAAYKSSLRAKHVLSDELSNSNNTSTFMGEEIFRRLASLERNISVKMVENYPPRDKGDNEDGLSLARRGIIDRRTLDFEKVFKRSGTMHSKFLIVDKKHFYLGSANFDWRSLNQKFEIGLLVKHCPCLANDLKSIFDNYWDLSGVKYNSNVNSLQQQKVTSINLHNPLRIVNEEDGSVSNVYLAASPPFMNDNKRTWDLDGILHVINNAQRFIYINVMDYVPMFLYKKPRKYWPIIDDAIRRAVVERQVELKLMSAALHFVPQNLHFLKSLQSLDLASNGSVQIKILRIPSETPFHNLIARDRRTHRKFMVTEDHVVIGTSNWSGDYFNGSTGVQIFVQQNYSMPQTFLNNNNDSQGYKDNSTKLTYGPFVEKMRALFLRDWRSIYAHDLDFYIQLCLKNGQYYENYYSMKNRTLDDSEKRRICEPIRK